MLISGPFELDYQPQNDKSKWLNSGFENFSTNLSYHYIIGLSLASNPQNRCGRKSMTHGLQLGYTKFPGVSGFSCMRIQKL